jgi:hypothetical protein
MSERNAGGECDEKASDNEATATGPDHGSPSSKYDWNIVSCDNPLASTT